MQKHGCDGEHRLSGCVTCIELEVTESTSWSFPLPASSFQDLQSSQLLSVQFHLQATVQAIIHMFRKKEEIHDTSIFHQLHTYSSLLGELLAHSTVLLQSTTLFVSCLACNMFQG